MKGDKIFEMGWFGVVMSHPRSLEIVPFDRAPTSSYLRSIVTTGWPKNWHSFCTP